uniref:Uncharacterized protein n=1 Tax=Anguilla anguilla TaxID=7936 RepID=A0A0E9QIL4_ANGAN
MCVCVFVSVCMSVLLMADIRKLLIDLLHY